MFDPLVMLGSFVAVLVMFGVLAHWCGFDSRDGLADQAHGPFWR